MNKKLVSLVLSGLIVLNSTGSLKNIYADSDNKSKELIKNEDSKLTKDVYLENGEGDENVGDGSANNPYQNIRTALSKINDGDTLKIKGTVQYSKYKQDTNGAALPLEIDKSIIIEGEAGAVFSVRGSIQLKADVTFKDLNIELVPEVWLGRGTSKSSERMLGQIVERSATIYANGNILTLDNINTKIGTNLEQSKYRPCITGGSHKSSNAPTGKSVINIINSNEETKFSGIYAGDYNKDVTLDVDINIDGKAKVTDNKIYTGGYDHDLNGTVNINLSASNSNNKVNSIAKFDKANHNGNINVNLNKDAFVYNFDATNINDLTLEEGSKIILSNNANFDVDNVVLKNDATIDFTQMTNNNPIVKGNFTGESNISDLRKGGIILLGGNQVLDIKGKSSGTTRLSHSNVEMFEDGHVYVKTHEVSDGNFILEDGISDYYELNKIQNGNGIDWTIGLIKEVFGSFKWIDDNKIEAMNNSTNYGEGIFKIEFTNAKGEKYTPYNELYTDFEYTLTISDEYGNTDTINLDEENNMGIEFYICSDYPDVELAVFVENMNNLKDKKITLKVTHIESKVSAYKEVYNDIKYSEVPDKDYDEGMNVVPEDSNPVPDEDYDSDMNVKPEPEVEEKPETPDTEENIPEDILKPEQSIIEDISKIEGIKVY